MTYLLALVMLVVGALAMAAGQADDSPGLGGIGLFSIIGAVVLAARTTRRRSRSSARTTTPG